MIHNILGCIMLYLVTIWIQSQGQWFKSIKPIELPFKKWLQSQCTCGVTKFTSFWDYRTHLRRYMMKYDEQWQPKDNYGYLFVNIEDTTWCQKHCHSQVHGKMRMMQIATADNFHCTSWKSLCPPMFFLKLLGRKSCLLPWGWVLGTCF